MIGPEPGIGVPEVGEGLFGVRYRDRGDMHLSDAQGAGHTAGRGEVVADEE